MGGLLQLAQTADNSHTVHLGKMNIQDYQDVVESGASIHSLDIGGGIIDFQEGVPHAVGNLAAQLHTLSQDQCLMMTLMIGRKHMHGHDISGLSDPSLPGLFVFQILQ